MKTVTIYCADCFKAREIKPQDAFQVKRCMECQKKHAAWYRNLKAQIKRAEIAEQKANLDAIVTAWKTDRKISWENYTFVKYGCYDLSDRDAYSIWGKGECAASIDHDHDSYAFEDCTTPEEIEAKESELGAHALIDNEYDVYRETLAGKNDRDMDWYIEDAYKRIKGGK